jgi:hypothetical protein
MGLLSPALSNRDAMFKHWCRQALDYFAGSYSAAVREVEGKREFEEGRLRSYLVGKYEGEVHKAFGNPY